MPPSTYKRNLTLIGFLTWLIIGIPSTAWAWQSGMLTTPRGFFWAACFLGFLLCFAAATRADCEPRLQFVLIAAQSVLALTASALQTTGFMPILLVIVAGQLGRLPLAAGLTWISLQTVALWAVTSGHEALALAGAYFAFQLFGTFTTSIAYTEASMRQALAETNAELKVATRLLDISSRTEERLRIARDLHDVIGHHLTALSLNLEVATHLTDGPAREQIEKSKALTKTLLTDVREVVSRLRDQDPVDLNAAVESLRDVVDRPSVHLDVARDLAVKDPAVARVALRTLQEMVTNAVRHSGARNLWLKLATEDHTLSIEARDDGGGTDQVRFGNGLRGMRERVEELSGTLLIKSMRGRGFEVLVRIPLEGTAA